MKTVYISEEMLDDPPFIAGYLKERLEEEGGQIHLVLTRFHPELGPVPLSMWGREP